MRYRSLLAFLVISFVSLGLVGCGSSNDNTNFVNTANPPVQTTGAVQFNFVNPQAFTVDAATSTLLFEFFDATSTTTPVVTSTQDFAATVTVSNVPVSVTSVRITGFNANRIPLFTIDQTISVTGGETNVVPGLGTVAPVTLKKLRLAGGSIFDLDNEITSLTVEVGGTGQVFQFGEYSNGSIVLLGQQATYAIFTGGDSFASVNSNGTVSGLSVGTTRLLVNFGSQTLDIPLAVVTPGTQNYASIQVTNETKPIPVTAGTPVQIATSGTTSGGSVFGLNSSTLTYSLSNTTDFSITSGGEVSVNSGVAGGTTATVTVSYANPNTTTVSTTVDVVAQ